MLPELPLSLTFRGALLAVAALVVSTFSSCTNTSPKIDGLPGDLPSIPLFGQARTPPHRMSHADYPFDSNGNYVTSWAAEGGRSEGASDYRSSARHHDDDPPAPKKSTKASSRSETASSKKSPPPSKPTSSTKSKSTVASKSDSAPAKKPASSGGGGGTKHVVKGSDTLYGLARKYGTTVDKIKKANGLTSDNLRDGRTLTIP